MVGRDKLLFGDFWSYRAENKSILIVFRVEFDGDVYFDATHRKINVFIDCL